MHPARAQHVQLVAVALLVAAAGQLASAQRLYPRECPTGFPNNTYGNPALPLPYDGYEPAINNETMFLHRERHLQAAINVVNAVLARYPKLRDTVSLSEIVARIGKVGFNDKFDIAANDSTALRNNAGSQWNHEFFWRVMTTYNTSNPDTALSAELKGKIAAKYGSPTGLLDALRSAGAAVFGSGWAWVVYVPEDGSIAVVTTPNQDNPLMQKFAPKGSRGIPLLGVDVWEHAHYLKFRNLRASYLSAWVGLVDWAVVQHNYELAKANRVDALLC